jgi:glycosyltransferase involved in cell wall biosynthesis
MLVAPLGLDLRPVAARARPASQPPYFICVGTIEPKKNHLLLLNVWRQLAAAFGQDIPRLILVGQRGWENENVIDMIERSVRIRGLVEEHNSLPDSTMESLIVGARALLAPSFAEGYGLPVAEALSLGVPVLCSDLPALRAVGKEVPEYFDPLDGPAWRDAILDYARPDSARRHAQLMRLSAWRPHSWDEHFAAVTRLIDDLPPNPAREGRPLAHEPNGARGHH